MPDALKQNRTARWQSKMRKGKIEMKRTMESVNKEKQVLSIRETAQEFGFPEYTVRQLVKRGAFPVIRSGNRVYIVPYVFEEFLKSGGELYGE